MDKIILDNSARLHAENIDSTQVGEHILLDPVDIIESDEIALRLVWAKAPCPTH